MRKLFAVLFFLVLVFPLLFAAQTAVSAITWALDRDFYVDALSRPEVLDTLMSGTLLEQTLMAQFNLPAGADTTALENSMRSLVTTDFMKVQLEAYINGLFDYLQGGAKDFEPVVDISPLKDALSGDEQDEFLLALVAAIPVCEPGQAPGVGSENTPACKPDNVSDEVIIEQFLKPALPLVISQLPDEVPLEGDLALLSDDMRWRAYIPGMAAPASIILSAVILAFIAIGAWYVTSLIADSAWGGRLQWMGWMLLIPSLLVFLLGFATTGGVAAYWINFGLQRADLTMTPFGPDLANTLQIVAAGAIPRIANAFKMVGGICGAFALVFIFWGIATPRRSES